MKNQINIRKKNILKDVPNFEYYSAIQEIDFSSDNITKISLANISAMGVAFQPLTAVIQKVINGGGGSGIYCVNTKGKTMFQSKGSDAYIGSLQTKTGMVGGGQADIIQLPCDPTMLFMAVVLTAILGKLDNIQEIQKGIKEFLEQKEKAKLKGNLNVLIDIFNNYKFNWNNEKYKTNKHIQVQEIKRDAEQGILLYRVQIANKLKKHLLIHRDKEVEDVLANIQTQFKDYQLALYLYSFSSFIEIMLLENFASEYLENVVIRIEEYSYQYRKLYTECYNWIEDYSKSSIQANLLSGVSVASKVIGQAIAKVPVISKSQIDENLIETGEKLKQHKLNKATNTLEQLIEVNSSVVRPFVENIKTVKMLYNQPTNYFFDSTNLYVCKSEIN